MICCICASVMGCQVRCHCNLLLDLTMHCYALHDNICDACLFGTHPSKDLAVPTLDRRIAAVYSCTWMVWSKEGAGECGTAVDHLAVYWVSHTRRNLGGLKLRHQMYDLVNVK